MKYRNVTENLQWLTEAVRSGEPFTHLRWNDGEAKTMLGLVGEDATTSHEHHCYKDLGERLLSSFTEMCQESRNTCMSVGSYICDEPYSLYADELLAYVAEKKLAEGVPWATGDVWYSRDELVSADLIKGLLQAVRESGRWRDVVLVSNSTVEPARWCLKSFYVEVPKVNAWETREQVRSRLLQYDGDNTLFVWCSGLPGKVWAWELHKVYPGTSHLDLGHLFDGVYGLENRAWQKRKAGLHYREYTDIFAPWVRSFHE